METKICAPRYKKGYNPNYCYKTLPIEKFTWENKSKGLRRHACSSCRYKSEMRRYNKNPEAKQRRAVQKRAHHGPYMLARRVHLRSIINEIKLTASIWYLLNSLYNVTGKRFFYSN